LITLTNNGSVTKAGVAVRGNDSANFDSRFQHYLSGTITGIINNSFSVSMWLYSKTGEINKGTIMTFGSVNATRQSLTLGFGINIANIYKFSFFNDDCYSTSNFPEDINNWVHITWVYNSSTLERMIYRNGVKLTLIKPLAGGQLNINTNFRIGALYTNSYYYSGYIDDLRVYTGVVLSQAQITELYAGNPYYNLPTASTRYNTDPTNTTYQFEVMDDEQKIISHY
jgi:hypothetical protein